jgi:hypothetical protein
MDADLSAFVSAQKELTTLTNLDIHINILTAVTVLEMLML